MRHDSVKMNFIFNLFNQIVSFLLPLIITPYISRVLGAEAIGQYSFSLSVVQYFIFAASLGITLYAQRTIAQHKNKSSDQSRIFWEIVILRAIIVVIVFISFLFISSSKVFGTYTVLMNILSFNILATMFDITFFFQGNQKFSFIVLATSVIRVASVVLTFIFVKDRNDLNLYTWIQVGFLLVSNIILWAFLPRYLRRCNIKEFKIFSHFIPILRLFIPSLAGLVYTSIDKTLIGLLIHGETYHYVNGVTYLANISDLENGYYEQAQKIVSIGVSLIVALGGVMSPRNAREYAKGHYDVVKNNVYMVSEFIWGIGIPLVLGIVAIAPIFVPFFFGEGYEVVIPLLMVFAFLIILVSLTNLIGNQYLLASKKDKAFIIFVSIGCGLNVALSLALIPFFRSFGAVIATLISEFAILVLELYYVRKEIDILHILKRAIKFAISGVVMLVVLLCLIYFAVPYIKLSTTTTVILLIALGVFIYFGMLFILKEHLLFDIIRGVSEKIKHILHKNHSENSNEKQEVVMENAVACNVEGSVTSNIDEKVEEIEVIEEKEETIIENGEKDE